MVRLAIPFWTGCSCWTSWLGSEILAKHSVLYLWLNASRPLKTLIPVIPTCPCKDTLVLVNVQCSHWRTNVDQRLDSLSNDSIPERYHPIPAACHNSPIVPVYRHLMDREGQLCIVSMALERKLICHVELRVHRYLLKRYTALMGAECAA
jgi:hypothetical protein